MSNNTNTEIEWLQAAAERGDPRAQRQLGQRYLEGDGVPQDRKKAEMWLTMADDQGDAEARYRLAGMFNKDGGALEDKKKAAEWYQKAAAQRHYESQLFLGMMYLHGDGVDKDLKESYKWFSLSEDSGREMFQGMAEKVAGEKIYQELKDQKDEVIRSAKEAAAQWRLDKSAELKVLKADAENGNAEAQYKLGVIHLNGYQGIEKNIEKATKLIKSSAESGHADAQNAAGSEVYAAVTLIKLAGRMQGEDKIPGLLALTIQQIKEADNDERPGFRMKNDLGIMLLEGTDLDGSIKKAADWLKKAAEQGNIYAQYNLAQMYLNGHVVEDEDEAMKEGYIWTWIAARRGYDYILRDKERLQEVIEGDEIRTAEEMAKSRAEDIDKTPAGS